ncbi:MAG: ABC transporter ATP-binding protein [Thermoplasmata archaeon]|nr:ABC transporter ATP-binding protein [Thermoplasmata archaeon]
MTGGARLEVEHLVKSFSGRRALDDVSFDLQGSRSVGYLGPNGAGKTTTLKLLVGLLRPSGGRVAIDGFDPQVDRKRALERVGALIETPEPYPQFTGREVIEYAGGFRGVGSADLRDRIAHLQEALELPPLDQKVGRLSKGQRQRVVIAATLVADPPILLLDEPTSGLDPAERVRIRTLLLQLKKDHLILMSSHLLNEVTELCDEVIFLNQGKVVLRDSVEHLSARLTVRQVEVEFAEPVRPDQLSPLTALVHRFESMNERRYRLSFDGRDESRIRILQLCQGVAPVLSYAGAGSALEDVYMQLMTEPTIGGRETRAPPPPPPPPPLPDP